MIAGETEDVFFIEMKQYSNMTIEELDDMYRSKFELLSKTDNPIEIMELHQYLSAINMELDMIISRKNISNNHNMYRQLKV